MPIPPWNSPGMGPENAWDSLGLGGIPILGLWTVTGRVGEKIDVQPVKGTKGAKTTDEGPEPANLTISGKLTHEEALTFEAAVDLLHPRKSDQHSGPLTIDHPSASILGITQIRIKSISLPQIEDDHMVVTIEAIEYFEQPQPAKPKPKPVANTKPSEAIPTYYPVSNPWAPSGIDVLDDQWPANPANVNGVTPWGA